MGGEAQRAFMTMDGRVRFPITFVTARPNLPASAGRRPSIWTWSDADPTATRHTPRLRGGRAASADGARARDLSRHGASHPDTTASRDEDQTSASRNGEDPRPAGSLRILTRPSCRGGGCRRPDWGGRAPPRSFSTRTRTCWWSARRSGWTAPRRAALPTSAPSTSPRARWPGSTLTSRWGRTTGRWAASCISRPSPGTACSPAFIDLPWGLYRADTRSDGSDIVSDRRGLENLKFSASLISDSREKEICEKLIIPSGCAHCVHGFLSRPAVCASKREKNLWILNKRSIVRLRSSFKNEGDTATCDECLANLTFVEALGLKVDMQRLFASDDNFGSFSSCKCILHIHSLVPQRDHQRNDFNRNHDFSQSIDKWLLGQYLHEYFHTDSISTTFEWNEQYNIWVDDKSVIPNLFLTFMNTCDGFPNNTLNYLTLNMLFLDPMNLYITCELI